LFRTCPVTGFKVDSQAEGLIRANAVVAVVCLLIGGIFALLVALTRWPAIHLLGNEWYYRALTAHAINMLFFWIVFFEVAGLYFGSAVVLSAPLAWPRLAWLAFILMVGGAALTDLMIFTGQGTVLMTSYYPLKASPFFYLGIILFAVGALIACAVFFATLVVAKREKTYGEGSYPLFTFGLAAAAIIAVLTLAHGAIIYIPTFLWSLGLIPKLDAAMYRLIWWGFGHSSQQINVSAMVAVWYALASLTVGAKPVNEKICRTAFYFYPLFILIASAHHLQVDPGVSSAWKIWNTGYFMHLAVLASMIHAMAITAAVEKAQRAKGVGRGLFDWLARAPWGNPAFSGLFLSMVGFGFFGGITGVTYGTEQINIVAHNTYRIPGHFHGTVVAGTSLAFMAITYYVLPLIFRRQVAFPSLARIQPWLFGLGMYGVAGFLMLAGSYGIPRRHWDITFTGAPFAFEWDPAGITMLSLMGLSALLAILGGALFVLIAVVTVFFGKRVEKTEDVTFPVSAPAERTVYA